MKLFAFFGLTRSLVVVSIGRKSEFWARQMKRFKPLALALSLLAVTIPVARAADGATSLTASVDQGLAAGLDMMLLNASLLRNGDNVWERLRQGFQMQEVNSDLVQRQVRFYANRPELFKRTLSRSHKYLFYILNEVERRGMPTEIALLPMVESSFVPTATSPVGAAGLWQFMPTTGRQYGLEQTWWYDGRRDVTAATNAALDYLQNLYTQFGDWSLALAAYNWGEGNLARSIARTQASGLPVTYENVRMPAETRSYVPKLLAIRDLLADPASYGLKLDKFPNKPYFVAVNADRHMDIALAARLAGISVNEFMELNPAFNLPVYAYKAGRQMLLPANRAERFEANLAKWNKPLLTWQVYTPNGGETADEVAGRAGMSVTQFLSVNHLNGSNLAPGRPVLIAMKSGTDDAPSLIQSDGPTLLAANDSPSGTPSSSLTPAVSAQRPAARPSPVQVAAAIPAKAAPATAASTDSTPAAAAAAPLAIANAANTSAAPAAVDTAGTAPLQVADAQQTELRMPAADPVRPAPSAVTRVAMIDPVPQMAQAATPIHVVEAGDTLYNISRRYNMTVAELRALNNLSGNTVKLGQVLQVKRRTAGQTSDAGQAVPSGAVVPTEYVVQHGDTLYSIARHFGIDRGEIVKLNDPRLLSKLQPGQVVKIQGL
jgi:membrane-bound lytic murein transglycosylase D